MTSSRRAPAALLALFFSCSAAGCDRPSVPPPPSPPAVLAPPPPPVPPSATKGTAPTDVGPIHHVVIGWLKRPGDAAARAELLAAAKQLEAIAGVLSVQGGVVLPSERAVVDSSFDVGLVITVADREALSSYVADPIHQRLLKTTLKPLLERYVVYDLYAGR